MMFEEAHIGWGRRVYRAVIVLIMNALLWLVLPSIFLQLLSSAGPAEGLTLSTPLILTFGLVITGLQVLGTLLEGNVVSVPLLSGSYLASAYFIWAGTQGGMMTVTAGGSQLTLSFQPLLFLFILPSLFGIVRVPMTYLFDRGEASRPVSDHLS